MNLEEAKKTLAHYKRMKKEEEERKTNVDKVIEKLDKKDVDALRDELVLDLEWVHLKNLEEEIPRLEKIIKDLE